MKVNTGILLAMGGLVRYYMATSKYSTVLQNRPEIATPLNSFKRVKEGAYLLDHGVDPYEGDMVHEMPLILLSLASVLKTTPMLVTLVYCLIDVLTAWILYKSSQFIMRFKLQEEKRNAHSYASGTEDLQHDSQDTTTIPRLVLLVYLFNPMAVFSCAGLTSTCFSNLLLALTLYFMSKRQLVPCLIFMAVETMRNLYPFVLIAPAIIIFSGKSVKGGVKVVLLFASMCSAVAAVNFYIIKSWSFLDGTLGFIFFYRDLQPNIGLFWYFFTEMFEHFRSMFLITFQLNASVLYLLPMSFKLRKDPMLLATILLATIATFRSYPCIGDVSLYLALLPIYKRCWKFMAHNFIVFCFFLVTLCMMPTLWYLWIYSGSANANFFFGTTLGFCTGQIFLITDLFFAYVKREFCLIHGQQIFVNGKEAKIILD